MRRNFFKSSLHRMGNRLLVFIILVFPLSSRAPSFAQVNPPVNPSGIGQPSQLYREATDLLQKGKFEKAALRFVEIVTRWPDFCPAYTSLGIVYTRLGKPEEAAAYFSRAAQLNPNSALSHNNLGANYLALKKPAEAAAEFQKASALNPKDGSAWFNLGACELHMGHGPKAEQALQKAAGLNPGDVQILAALAEAQFNTGKVSLALTTVRKIGDLTPSDPNILLSLAVLLNRNRQPDQASVYFTRAVKLKPQISDQVMTLAGSRIDQGDYQAALSWLALVKDLKLNSAAWHDMVGYSHFKLNQIEPAMYHLQEAIRLEPTNEDYYLDLGDLLGQSNSLLAAVAVFESGIKVLPNSVKMRLGLAVTHLLTGNLELANQEIHAVIVQKPDSEIAYKVLLESYDKGMEWTKMQEAAQFLRQLNGANPIGWYYGAKCEYQMALATKGSFEPALKFIQRASELGPPDLKTYFLLGKILIAEKRDQEAIVALQKAIRLSSEDPRPFYVLARLLQRQGRNEEAKEVLGAQEVAKSKQDSSQFRRLFVDVR